jgi:hypothetical protein
MSSNTRKFLVAACAAAFSITAGASDTRQKPARQEQWIERPWELAYFIRVQSAWGQRVSKEGSAERNAADKVSGFLEWPALFDVTHRIQIDPNPLFVDEDLVVTRIEFDAQGWLTTANTHEGPLRGRLKENLQVVLAAGATPAEPVYVLGQWFQGFGGSEHWAPTLCGRWDWVHPALPRDHKPHYLYGKGYRHDAVRGSFGCREWAYQLKDDRRPYIDVTSYRPGAKPADTYVREFIGWAYLGQPRKPVIGLHQGQWYCLLDCPQGATPGRIGDINKWAAAHGWAAPKRPQRMPMFPDSMASRDADE